MIADDQELSNTPAAMHVSERNALPNTTNSTQLSPPLHLVFHCGCFANVDDDNSSVHGEQIIISIELSLKTKHMYKN
jgi:hypothetical protein